MRIVSRSTLVSLIAAAISGPGLAIAQSEQAYSLDEIVVTAERRESNIQSVALSVTAITPDTLRAFGVQNAQDLQNIVPGLTIRSSQIGQNNFTIRGIGEANDDASTDSGVGVYVDDIYMARTSAANLSLYDLERVEVLRGPQGTLYGRNTAGGSINIITAKPTEEFSGRIGLDVGSEGRLDAGAFISGPLVEGKLFAKASIASYNRDGIMTNLFDGTEGNEVDTFTGRIGIRYLPTDRTEFLFTYDAEQSTPGANLKSLGPNDGFESIASLDGPESAADPVRSANVDSPGFEDFETSGFMARLNVDYEPATLSFIAGHRTVETRYNEDFDRTVETNLNEIHVEDGSWGSVEVRLTSNPNGPWSAGGKLNWTAGLYNFTEDTDKNISFPSDNFAFILCNFVFPPFACPGVAPGTTATTTYLQNIDTTASAAFGQFEYGLTERLSLTAGLRYTKEEKDFTALSVLEGPLQPPFHPLLEEDIDCTGNKDFSNVSGKLALNFSLNDSSMIYGLFSQGYRSGGFNGQAPNNAEACGGFDEETANNYEFGIKSDWANNRIRTNVSVFYTDYEDLQVTVIPLPGSTPTTDNAADAEISGAEFEFQALLTEQVRFYGNLAVLDATFKEFLTFEQGAPVDKSGQRIAEVPDTTYNLGLEWTLPLASGANVTVRGDYVWEDETKIAGVLLPQWEVANFRIAYAPSSQKWEIAAWVRNAFDELYWTATGVSNTADINAVPRLLEDPRTYGISFNFFLGDG